MGVALSHLIPNFDSAPAYVNAVFLPMIFISGVFYDADDAPRFLRGIAEVLPLKHLIDGLSGAMVTGEGVAHQGSALLVLAIWTAAGTCSPSAASRGTGARLSARAQLETSRTQVPPPAHDVAGAAAARPIPARP